MHLMRCLLWSLVAAAAMCGQVLAQNGLQRFERDIKPQLELDKFTYGSASALGAAGFVLNDVVAVMPATPQTGDKPSTIKIDRITVEEFDFERVPPAPAKGQPRVQTPADDDMPRFAKLRLEGISGDDDLHSLLAPYGIPRAPVDVVFDYRLDPASKVLTVNKIELSLRGLARLELSLVLDNVSDKASKLESAKDESRLRTASLVIDDKGLLALLLPAMAQANGGTAEMWVGMAQAPLQGFAAGQGPETLKALDAVASFLTDWKAPKGPIRIVIKPPQTTGVEDLAKVLEPNGLTDVLGLTVAYEGTRPGAASGGAGSGMGGSGTTTPRATRQPRTTDPQAGGDAKRLTGKAAWDLVVGNTLTGRSGGKTYHDYYRADGTIASLLDGEITPAKWTLEGEKVCTKYPEEDKICYTVVASGRTVTMTDDKGKGLRATLLRGNPKDL